MPLTIIAWFLFVFNGCGGSPRGLGTNVNWVLGYSRHLVSVLTAQLEGDSITFS